MHLTYADTRDLMFLVQMVAIIACAVAIDWRIAAGGFSSIPQKILNAIRIVSLFLMSITILFLFIMFFIFSIGSQPETTG